MNVYPEDFPIVDGYEYVSAGEKKKFIVETEDHYDDVTLYDQTHYFSDHYIVESYKKQLTGNIHTYTKHITMSGINFILQIQVISAGFLKKSLKMNWITYHSPHMKK